MEWEQGIDTAECCNEMILECGGGVVSVEINFLLMHEIFECFGAFVVEFLKLCLSPLITSLVWSVLYAARMLAAVRLGMGCRNGVAVIVVEDH